MSSDSTDSEREAKARRALTSRFTCPRCLGDVVAAFNGDTFDLVSLWCTTCNWRTEEKLHKPHVFTTPEAFVAQINDEISAEASRNKRRVEALAQARDKLKNCPTSLSILDALSEEPSGRMKMTVLTVRLTKCREVEAKWRVNRDYVRQALHRFTKYLKPESVVLAVKDRDYVTLTYPHET
jgi:hypothetical protein